MRIGPRCRNIFPVCDVQVVPVAFFLVVFLGFMPCSFALSPQGDWVVGPISSSANGGKSFCSLKNVYDGAYHIVFARDDMQGDFIAVTLDKERFSAGRQYQSVFTVGPIKRVMNSIAATTRVLITKLGDDPNLYEMLTLKEVLNVEVDGKRLAFDLKGFAKGFERLDDCAQKVGTGEKFPVEKISIDGTAVPDIPSKPLSTFVAEALEENKDFKLSEQSLENKRVSEIESLRREKIRLERENQLISSRLQVSDLQAIDMEASRLAEFERKERALMIENEHLREKLEKIQQKKSAGSQSQAAPPPVETPSVPVMEAKDTAGAAVLPQKNVLDIAYQAAGVPAQSTISSGEDGSRSWSWQKGEVYISLQELPNSYGADMKAYAERYIDTVSQRCAGDFAHKISGSDEVGGHLHTLTAEIACIDNLHDSVAALVFLAQAEKAVVVTYESAKNKISDILSMRDSFVSRISSAPL